MRLLIFLSGACFGTVAGILVGYLALADELREARQANLATQASHAGHDHGTPSGHPPAGGGAGDPGAMDDVMALIAKWKKHTTEHPEDPDGWIQLAAPYQKIGRWAQVVEFLGKALALKPEDPKLLQDLGLAQLQLGKPKIAEPLLRKAMAVAPDHPQPRIWLAVALTEQNRFDEALKTVAPLEKSPQKDVRDMVERLRESIARRRKAPPKTPPKTPDPGK